MEFIGILLVLAIVALIFAGPIFALLRAGKANRLAKQTEERVAELTARVYTLEQNVKKLPELAARVAVVESRAAQLEQQFKGAPAVEPPAPRPGAPPTPSPILKAPAIPPPQVSTEPPKVSARPSAIPSARPPKPEVVLPSPLPPPRFEPPPTAVAPGVAAPSVPSTEAAKASSLSNLEEALGTNWLNKLGVIVLVIGVALFLAYELKTMGHAGKIMVGYLTAASLLGAGIIFERREHWRIIAHAGIGGGWALIFFTTYAMRFIEASRIEGLSDSADLILLLILAAGMVAHTLRYHSQAVTGLAFLLAFSTVNIGHGGVGGLWAGAILAAGLCAVAVRRQWFELEVFGILAAYLNHFYWVYPFIQRVGRHHVFPEITASTVLLIAYWLIFRASYVMRKIKEEAEEKVSTVAALLSTFLFHGVTAYQAAQPKLAFRFLFWVGAAEMVFGQLPITRRRRTAFVVLSTIGATLLIAAFPYLYVSERSRLSGAALSIVWLLEAEALILVGVFMREILFRRLGTLAALVVAVQMVYQDAARLARLRDLAATEFSDLPIAALFGVAALVLYLDAHWVAKRWSSLIDTKLERWSFQGLSYLAGLLALVGVWAASSEPWMAVGCVLVALVLAVAGHYLKVLHLSVQAAGFAALGMLRYLTVNLALETTWHHYSLRLITGAAMAALLYLASPWAAAGEITKGKRVAEGYTWAASFLVALLAWYELNPAAVALAWGLVGLVLFESGLRLPSGSLRLQGYLAFSAAFFRAFFANMNAEGYPGELSPRLVTVAPLALLFVYVYVRMAEAREEFLEREQRLQAPELAAWLGTLTLLGLARFELAADSVAPLWALVALGLTALAWRTGRPLFLYQGLFVAFAAFFRAVLHNLYQRSYFPSPSFWLGRWFTVGTTVALLLAALPFAFRLRSAPSSEAGPPKGRRIFRGMISRPEQVLFFLAFAALTLLVGFEMKRGWMTVGWGIEAVAVFLFALRVEERSFRLAGLALLLGSFVKIALHDAFLLEGPPRYLTFIVLGAAMLGVSILYKRHRTLLRRYL